jgi:hypothetical protein
VSGDNRLPVLVGEIRAAQASIERGAIELAERVIEAGKRLLEAKDLLAHGQWLPWLAEHVQIPARTASNYMRIALSGMKSAAVADLGISGAIALISKSQHLRPTEGKAILVVARERMAVVRSAGEDRFRVDTLWYAADGSDGWIEFTKRPVPFWLLHCGLSISLESEDFEARIVDVDHPIVELVDDLREAS